MKHIRKLFYWLISALILPGVTDVFAKFQNTEVSSINAAILVKKLDLSGTSQGAGGVGGLLMVSKGNSTQTHHFTCFDGNGNIVALVNASDGSITVRYEYGPFGEVICGNLLPGEQFIGCGITDTHAEIKILNWANQNNLSISAIGATRPVCVPCQSALDPAGIIIAALRKP